MARDTGCVRAVGAQDRRTRRVLRGAPAAGGILVATGHCVSGPSGPEGPPRRWAAMGVDDGQCRPLGRMAVAEAT